MLNPIRFINRLFESLFELPAKLVRLPVSILVTILDIRFWIRMVLYSIASVLLILTLAYAAPVIWAPIGLRWIGAVAPLSPVNLTRCQSTPTWLG